MKARLGSFLAAEAAQSKQLTGGHTCSQLLPRRSVHGLWKTRHSFFDSNSSKWDAAVAGRLTPHRHFVDDVRGEAMKSTRFPVAALAFVVLLALPLHAQDNPAKDSQSPEASADSATAVKRLRIEVTGGEKNVAVESASVYLKYVEEKKLFKDRKYALNVKTNRSGVAHIPDPPMGKVLIQIVADGWKTYGKYYELTDPGEVIKIHLDRPPKWY
jgi:hypothetical protein